MVVRGGEEHLRLQSCEGRAWCCLWKGMGGGGGERLDGLKMAGVDWHGGAGLAGWRHCVQGWGRSETKGNYWGGLEVERLQCVGVGMKGVLRSRWKQGVGGGEGSRTRSTEEWHREAF